MRSYKNICIGTSLFIAILIFTIFLISKTISAADSKLPLKDNCHIVTERGNDYKPCKSIAEVVGAGDVSNKIERELRKDPNVCLLVESLAGGADISSVDCKGFPEYGLGRTAEEVRADAGQAIVSDDREEAANCDEGVKKCLEKNPIIVQIEKFINFLSAGVGIVIIIMVVIGGIQYISAGSSPDAVSAAKSKIVNALIALLAFIFMYSFLQWLVPGGVF